MGTHIFIWLEFAPDYSNGLAFAIASNEQQAREYVIEKLGYNPDDWGPCESYCLAEVSEIAGAIAGSG